MIFPMCICVRITIASDLLLWRLCACAQAIPVPCCPRRRCASMPCCLRRRCACAQAIFSITEQHIFYDRHTSEAMYVILAAYLHINVFISADFTCTLSQNCTASVCSCSTGVTRLYQFHNGSCEMMSVPALCLWRCCMFAYSAARPVEGQEDPPPRPSAPQGPHKHVVQGWSPSVCACSGAPVEVQANNWYSYVGLKSSMLCRRQCYNFIFLRILLWLFV